MRKTRCVMSSIVVGSQFLASKIGRPYDNPKWEVQRGFLSFDEKGLKSKVYGQKYLAIFSPFAMNRRVGDAPGPPLGCLQVQGRRRFGRQVSSGKTRISDSQAER